MTEKDTDNAQVPSETQDPAHGLLRTMLEREHRDVDAGIEHFMAHGPGASSSAHLRDTLDALRRHIYLEEEILFPALRSLGLTAPVMVMLAEHRDLWQTMALLEAAVADGSSPTELHRLGATILAQLDRHNAKEEPIVYAAAEAGLDGDAQAELVALIEKAEMPTGWTCRLMD